MREPQVKQPRFSLCAWILLAAGSAISTLPAQNARGFIESDQWACLLPLAGNDCRGGGEEAMKGDWFAPHVLATEYPKLGTVWGDIDFGRTAGCLGYLGVGEPKFVRLSLGVDRDDVDLDEYLRARGLPSDFVMAVAVTYIENTTGSPLPAVLCTSSDDSLQVWLNEALVVNASVCRPLPSRCGETTPVILAPGTNRILVVLWDGIGEFEFRLGFTRSDGSPFTEVDAEILYLGSQVTFPPSDPRPSLLRSYPGEAHLSPGPSHEVKLSPRIDFKAGETYRVVEELRGDVKPSDISAISQEGVTEELFDEPLPAAGQLYQGTVGTPCSRENSTVERDGVYTTRATTGGDIWTDGDTFAFAFAHVEGDFDVAVKILDRRFPPAGRWGKFGLMIRRTLDASSRFGQVQDHGPDLTDRLRYGSRPYHLVTPSAREHVIDPNTRDPNSERLLDHTTYMRLTRRGDQVQAWVSHTAGDPGFDPTKDANWFFLEEDDWSGEPSTAYVGFAYSVHSSSGCVGGEIDWTFVTRGFHEAPLPSAGARISWDVKGPPLNAKGLSYEVTAPRGTILQAWGHAEGAITEGPRILSFQGRAVESPGIFDSSHDIGLEGPCAPGSMIVEPGKPFDPSDDVYLMEAGGRDVWADGDQFHFAHKEWTGDFLLRARIATVNHAAASRWGKHGLMARWDCRPTSAYFWAHDADATNSVCEIDAPRAAYRPRGGAFDGNVEIGWGWWQDIFGGEPLHRSCWPVDPDPRANDLRGDERNKAPYLQLVRRGNTLYGYASGDGKAWDTLGSCSWVHVPPTLLVGLAATSHSECSPLQVSFEEVRLEAPPALEPRAEAEPPFEGTEIIREDFDAEPDGSCPEGWICSRRGDEGGFSPQVVAGKLRMADMERSPLGPGNDNATTAFLGKPIDPSGAYLFDFDVRFGWDPALGALSGPGHGLTFCLLGTSTGARDLGLRIGDSGGSLGYGGIHVSRDEATLRTRDAARNSFALEFDAWYHEDRNDGTGANISGWDEGGGSLGTGTAFYHIGLDVDSCVSSAQRNLQLGVRDEELPDIFHPGGIHARVFYDRGIVKCWVRSSDEDEEPRLVIDYQMEPVEFNSPEALVGFTSATGEPSAIMEVDNLVVTDLLQEPAVLFHRGDADDDGLLNITDPISLLNHLFLGGRGPTCLEAANADDRDGINITDCIYLLNYLFLGGPEPPSPGPVKKACGPDPEGSPSDLGCRAYSNC